MSRRRSKGPAHRQVTIYLSDDDVLMLDQWQTQFGLDTRGLAVLALMRAGASAIPLDTAIFEIAQASARATQKFISDGLADFCEQQTATLRGTRRQ